MSEGLVEIFQKVKTITVAVCDLPFLRNLGLKLRLAFEFCDSPDCDSQFHVCDAHAISR